METDYKPISCAFYDELEAAAVKHIHSTITYMDENSEKTIQGKIVDFKTLNRSEFLILEDGTTIRLDTIIQFNDKKPTDLL